jgi:hypothetical protein
MKTTFIFSLIFSCFFLFSSCSADDETSENKNSEIQTQLLGNWLYEGLTVNGEFEEPPVEEGAVFYEFKAGGVFIERYENVSETGTYKLTGNKLSLSIDSETEVYEITKINNSELDLFGKFDVDEEEGLDEVTFHLIKN